MKTTKTLRTLVCATAIMVIGCAGLVAQPKQGPKEDKDNKRIEKIEEIHRQNPPKENDNLRSITGKIGTFTKNGTRFITITSVSSKKSYIINVDEPSRENYKELPGNKDYFEDENEVTVDYLLDNVGKKVTLTGILNKDCGVFSIIKSGTIPRQQPPMPKNYEVDAK